MWCCKVTLAPGKSLDDVFTVCEAVKVDARNVIGAFAGVLTESRFQLLIKDPGSENYFTARDVAEDIAKKKKIKGYTFQENVLGSKKDMEKGCAAAGQTIFAYCPGLDAVLNLEVKRDTPEGEQRRQDMFAVGDIITQKVREGQQQQTNKIEKKVAEATKEAKEYNAKLAAEQLMIQREEAKLRDEKLMAHQDQNTAMIVDVVKNNNALAEENRALRLELQEAHERERALQQALPGSSLPELEQAESGQLALQNEHQVEPPSAGSGTLGVTPRTNSVEIRRALGREFSLLRGDRPSPESPESSQEADDDDDAIVEAAPLQGAVAAAALDDETVEAAPLQGAGAAAALDDQTVAAPAAVATPARAVGFDQELLRTSKSAWAWSRKKNPLTENYKDQPKYESPPVRDCPTEGKKKDPNWCPDKLELNAVNSTP